MRLAQTAGRSLAGYLARQSPSPYEHCIEDESRANRIIQPADVLLVEGRSKISTAIKYLTQSTWSHAALCVRSAQASATGRACLVEADVNEGVREVTLDEYSGYHLRICRPVGLRENEVEAVVQFALSHIGDGYDLANIFDLARYLLPTPPVPTNWRRRMIALGSGEPTKAICSTLIAQAFQSIRYPILPLVTHEQPAGSQGAFAREILHIRHHSLFAPRDFDASPYFRIIKPTIENGFDFHMLSWDRGEHNRKGAADATARRG